MNVTPAAHTGVLAHGSGVDAAAAFFQRLANTSRTAGNGSGGGATRNSRSGVQAVSPNAGFWGARHVDRLAVGLGAVEAVGELRMGGTRFVEQGRWIVFVRENEAVRAGKRSGPVITRMPVRSPIGPDG
ncbi:hypothetical protein ACFVXG_12385 [Kitasatospora sp. NPDC058162]|uniref:hypothetical protein n=1 Tax=Kitasatospora sp. NPDC058162 TaxID=3346362 RepID=UPI0036DDD391